MTYCIKPSFILLHIRYSIGYLEFPLFYLLFLEVIKDDKVLLYTIGNRFADMFNAYAIRLLYFDKIYISYCIWSYGLWLLLSKTKKMYVITLSLALLFQPLIKLPLGRDIWNFVDIVTAIFLIYLFFVEKQV